MSAYPLEDDPIARAIGEALIAAGQRLAIVETTAGGLISARLLSVPGASAWFDRGLVAYSGGPKLDMLGLDRDFLREHGAVSAPAVAAMAEAMRKLASVDFAVAESGIAGPQGSRRSPKPVGSVVIAVTSSSGTRVEEATFPGTRVEVMCQIADRCLGLLQLAIQPSATTSSAVNQ
jgi:PncC family amidohydrolase